MTSVFSPSLLAGKLALITGGGSGICLGIARAFARHGATVVVMGRRREVLEQAVARIRADGGIAHAHAGDVSNKDDCLRVVDAAAAHAPKPGGPRIHLRVAFRRLASTCLLLTTSLAGYSSLSASSNSPRKLISSLSHPHLSIDVLVNGAAGNFLCRSDELTANAFRRVIEIDTIGTFNMSKAALVHLKRTRRICPLMTSERKLTNIQGTRMFVSTSVSTSTCLCPIAVNNNQITQSINQLTNQSTNQSGCPANRAQ